MTAHPRLFDVIRHHDPSCISGIGVIAQGVQFRDGQTVVQWCVPDMPRATHVWDSVEDMLKVHGHGGLTEVRWMDVHDD